MKLFSGFVEIEIDINPVTWIDTAKALFARFPDPVGHVDAGNSICCDGYPGLLGIRSKRRLTREGVKKMINDLMRSQHMDQEEQFQGAMRLYDDMGSGGTERNWIAATQSFYFYIYDCDGGSKNIRKNLEWVLPKELSKPITAYYEKDEHGNKLNIRVDFGEFRTGWLASFTKYDGRLRQLEREIREL